VQRTGPLLRLLLHRRDEVPGRSGRTGKGYDVRQRNRTDHSGSRARSIASGISRRLLDTLAFLLLLTVVFQTFHVRVAAGQGRSDDAWCDETDHNGRARFCEVREFTLAGSGALVLDAGQNGGIEVTGWDGDRIEIRARVRAWARSEDEAEEIARKVEIITDKNDVHPKGPRGHMFERGRGWSVSWRIRVPVKTDLDLTAFNGGISVSGVDGRMRLETLNGGMHLDDLAGDVRARTTNGGVAVTLSGRTWDGEGLDAETTNGGVTVEVPDDYSAEFETGTVNGGLDIDIPVRLTSRHRKVVRTTLGDGGPRIQVTTTNGGVRVRRI